ncbi:ATP:cob(I)alamin adenosyltransferase, partial [Candidatus Microgenomates bacterium]|nr:ATP:cob(I)alamin adenosyltransferase [Candidatus Microgenomates bacterium]
TLLSGWLHILRVITRGAERSLILLVDEKGEKRLLQGPVPYLNRLSDLFFTMARIYNKEHEVTLGKT